MTYYQLSESSVVDYVDSITELKGVLGGEKETWRVKEIGDGNVNFIFLLIGDSGAFVLKQAPPFIRIAPSWALTSDRIYYEHAWFQGVIESCQEFLPEILYFNRDMSVLVESYLTPDIILRNGMIEGIEYPLLAEHISTFCARSLFYTSDLYMDREEKQALVRQISENVMMHITEGVIFTEPFIDHPNNKHNPMIDSVAQEIKKDVALKLKVSEYKNRFMSSAEALLHGDLHTGSIMLTQEHTHVIDAEFTSYGPMGFDLGLLIGNMIISYLAQIGYPEREAYQLWIKRTIVDIWNLFTEKFIHLWNTEHKGELYNFLKDDKQAIEEAQKQYLSLVFRDTIGFSGIVLIRRTIGMAHVADVEQIEDETIKAKVQTQCLYLGRQLTMKSGDYQTIEEVIEELDQY
eukprot:TRINITY_DN2720_c0_g1_i1.p1 TRINITY_DN2720_c0_g1~~TRINITY_DN2720_c0_g1_i1.p1  ORF type:complete len:404 (+),score=82.84 TRINITY_DN2720_c0_g1_i1:122-1333(+)